MESLLSIPFLIFLPLAVCLIMLSPLFTNNEIATRRFAKWIFGFHFLYSVIMLTFFDSANPYVFELHLLGQDWIQSLGIKFGFKIDNISIVLITLTSFIFFISSISSKMHIRKKHKFYYSMLMLLMFSILGIFSASDMFVFFMFWELELIPAYFLIGGDWGLVENNAKKSAIKFVLFTFLGSMFMLVGILLIHYYNYISSGILSADFSNIFTTSIPESIQYFISICLIIGFGVKLPIIPLHTWLPDAHSDAPTPVSIVLAGILLKTGAYGIYKFNYEMLHDIFVNLAPILAIFALVNILYTAFVAYSQTDIKRIVAYSSISNMGLILLGLCAGSKISVSASVFHMIAHGLVTAGLFMICGIVYLRCKTRNINILSGLANKMPRLFAFSVLIVLASIGIPVFAPFISEILIMLGAMLSDFNIILKICSLLSLPLLIISSCYMLKFLHKSFFGEQLEAFEKINDIAIHEYIVLASILGGLILFGLYPQALLNIIN